MDARRSLHPELESLFERYPDLWGFAIGGEPGGLYVSDVGVTPRLSGQRYDEMFRDIAETLTALLEDEPAARDWLLGRTFARSLH